MNINKYLIQKQKVINNYLGKVLPKDNSILSQAIRYSTLGKGKRIRAILALASAEIFGTKDEIVLPAAAALEMAHAFSLIHDDLPSMDNDDLRRGLPSTHIKFGEAQAILAGDALNTMAFETLALKLDCRYICESAILKAIVVLGKALGYQGMGKGQSLDLLKEGKNLSKRELIGIYKKKTGALIRASIIIGALLSNAQGNELSHLKNFADHIGLAFQIKDDILDTEDKSDIKNKKATFILVLGLKKSKQILMEEINAALKSLNIFGNKASALIKISKFVAERNI